METVEKLAISSRDIHQGELETICQLPHAGGKFYRALKQQLLSLEKDPILSVLDLDLKDEERHLSLDFQGSSSEGSGQPSRSALLDAAFESMKLEDTPEVTLGLAHLH